MVAFTSQLQPAGAGPHRNVQVWALLLQLSPMQCRGRDPTVQHVPTRQVRHPTAALICGHRSKRYWFLPVLCRWSGRVVETDPFVLFPILVLGRPVNITQRVASRWMPACINKRCNPSTPEPTNGSFKVVARDHAINRPQRRSNILPPLPFAQEMRHAARQAEVV